jgi:spermidine synthase
VKPFGHQLLAELLDCQPPQQLARAEQVQVILTEAILAAGLDLRELVAHQFEPEGVTAVAIIGESHVAVHTYPESAHLAVDIFTCAPGSGRPERLLELLCARFRPGQVRRAELSRGAKIALLQPDLLTDVSPSAHDIRYHVQATLLQTRSHWQEIRIIENPRFGRMLFLDQELQIAESDRIYHQTLIEPLRGQAGIRRVAVLGGGDGGVLRELFLHLPELEQVWLLELDPAVVDAARRFLPGLGAGALEDSRLTVCAGDVLQHLPALAELDAVISDLGLSPWRHTRTSGHAYWPQLLIQVAASLRGGGIFSLQTPLAENYFSHELLTRVGFACLWQEQAFIPSFCELWSFMALQRRSDLSWRTPFM